MVKKFFGIFLLFIVANISYGEHTIMFSNLLWEIRAGFGNPHANQWSEKNVWVDDKGWLHLRISYQNGAWYCAGITTTEHLGFGNYWFLINRDSLRQLNSNTTLALFNYTRPDVGVDETNEIDIELSAKDDVPNAYSALYTVWPVIKELGYVQMAFTLKPINDPVVQEFNWISDRVIFESDKNCFTEKSSLIWPFYPADFLQRIPQQPLPVKIYFYIKNKNMVSKKDIEVVIQKFCFKSSKTQKSNC